MAKVKHLNVELTVADAQVEEYLEMGYSLLDEEGNVVRKKETAEDKVVRLNEELTAILAQNEYLAAENKTLSAENSELVASVNKLTEDINALKRSHVNSNELSDKTPSNTPTKNTRAKKGV